MIRPQRGNKSTWRVSRGVGDPVPCVERLEARQFLSAAPTPTPASMTSGQFLYVFDSPENIQGSQKLKHEIEVYNIGQGNKWVKNIPLPNDIYNIRGVAASAVTDRLYVAFLDGPADGEYPGGLLCMNLDNNSVIYERKYPTSVTPSVDRFDLTPNGKTIYMPTGEAGSFNYWTIIDAMTGSPEGRITAMSSAHDTIVSANGQYAFLEGQEHGAQAADLHHSIAVVSTATNKIVKIVGPFNNVVRPYTVNADASLVYVTENNFIGFQIGSVTTGKVLFTVPVPGVRQPNPSLNQDYCHGIAITPNGKYIYLVNTSRNGVYVFDVSGVSKGIAPTYLKFIPTRKPGHNPAGQLDPAETNDPTGLPAWIMSSYNGQYMYTEGGDVISTATNTVVANLRAETTNSSGKLVLAPYTHSRSMIEVDFNNGLAIRTTDQFGIGHD